MSGIILDLFHFCNLFIYNRLHGGVEKVEIYFLLYVYEKKKNKYIYIDNTETEFLHSTFYPKKFIAC